MSSIDAYRELVAKRAAASDDEIIRVDTSERRAIIAARLFQSAKSEVLIYGHCLDCTAAGESPQVIASAREFLAGNSSRKIRILLSKSSGENHVFLKALRPEQKKGQLNVQIIRDTPGVPAPSSVGFILADHLSYSLIQDFDPTRGIARFGNAGLGRSAQIIFDTYFAASAMEAPSAEVCITSIIIPETRVAEGILIKSTSSVWAEIVAKLNNDWSEAYKLSAQNWEEIVAGAFKRAGYDEVILTPRSGDHGRDVIAFRHGIGCIKVIGSVKAYKPGNLVTYDAVRSLIGVLSGEQNASKGIIATTSDFPPLIERDPFIRPFLPTRLELINGEKLRLWLSELSTQETAAIKKHTG
jgi:restriction system protein